MPNVTTNLDQLLQIALQHHQAGRVAEAEQLYRQILAQQPNHTDALHLLGVLAAQVGRADIAVNLLQQVIALKPESAEAYNDLAVALHTSGQLDEVIVACRRAIALRPSYPDAHYNLGVSLKEKRQFDEAIAAYRQTIALRPNYPEAHNNLANVLNEIGQLDEAIAAFRHAIALRPNFPKAYSNLLFTLNYHPSFDASAIAEEARRWDRQHAEPLRQFTQPHPNHRDPNRRLRIGYVSPDFYDHVVGRNLLPLFRQHNRQQFEITCYSNVARPDALTRQFQMHTDRWRNAVAVLDEQMAEQIRADQIDILVDLTMHTENNRLLVFARKPAPIQVTFAAYPGTTGLSTIDYRLSDPYLDPPGMDESIYIERTCRLPHTFWCYDPLDGRNVPVNPLPASVNGYITFGCLNNFCKVNDEVLRLWARVLRAVDRSRLLLLVPQGSARQHVLDLLHREGVQPDRIEFAARLARPQYLQLYHRIDLALDTIPYNGHTTSLDSFWMGVPVVTLVGQTIVGRAGLSQLMNLNLPDLIAQTPEEYIEIAAALATDQHGLAELRATFRARMERSPLMNAPQFARDIEAAYRQMWKQWCLEQR